VAIADYRSGDVLHRRLRGYKDAPVAEARAACTVRLASMMEGWLADPRPTSGRLAGPWDVVATVPSSSRPEGAPVDAVVGAVAGLSPRFRPLLVRGPEPTGHLVAARRGFILSPGATRNGVRGLRVLVVDDSVVTGARVQSAAAALRLEGATVVGAVALGRLVAGPTDPCLVTARS
jgi:adenine/guanine phosphoribosyltransferase-like PRPP-binding protein